MNDVVKVTSKSSMGWIQRPSGDVYETDKIFSKIYTIDGFKVISNKLYVSIEQSRDGYILASTVTKVPQSKTLIFLSLQI